MTDELIEEHIYTSEQKIKWFGYGEWVEEPDKVLFTYKGYNCMVFRLWQDIPCDIESSFLGHLNGYVKIPKDHKLYRKDYGEMPIDCHGGLTFGEEDKDQNYWIGFDCAHSMDCIPRIELFKNTSEHMKEFRKKFPISEDYKSYRLFNPTYKNVQYCIDECKRIVDQLSENNDR